MDVEQWRNNTQRDKKKDPEEAFLSTSSTTYSTSILLVFSWVTAGRDISLSCVVDMKRFKFSLLLAI
jgi:hypothetical protein